MKKKLGVPRGFKDLWAKTFILDYEGNTKSQKYVLELDLKKSVKNESRIFFGASFIIYTIRAIWKFKKKNRLQVKFPLIWGTTFLLRPFSFQMAYFPTHCKTMYLQFDSQFSGFIFRNKYLIYALIMICSKISMFLGISSQNKGLFSSNGGKSHPKNAQKMSIIT